MKLYKLVGVVDRITSGVAAVVPNDGSREKYVPADAVPDLHEGQNVDLLVVLPENPNAICKIVSSKQKKAARPTKIRSDATLLKAMSRSRDRLKATIEALESKGGSSTEELDELREKLEFLERGLELFS